MDPLKMYLLSKNDDFPLPCDIHSGQILATSHDLTPTGGWEKREIPLLQGNLGWWVSEQTAVGEIS